MHASGVYALLGQPVAGNPTRQMVEAAWRAAGVAAQYVDLEVEPAALPDAFRGLRALGFAGGHVTRPHKIAAVALVDRLTPSAAAVGAVNCLRREGDALAGDNTDGKGFLASLRTVADPEGAHAVVLGAGGAARAVAVELALAGAARVSVVSRSTRAGAGARGHPARARHRGRRGALRRGLRRRRRRPRRGQLHVGGPGGSRRCAARRLVVRARRAWSPPTS